jgi:uncharacterized protein (TIGR03435 family)
MNTTTVRASIVFLISCSVYAQETARLPEFEVASIKLNKTGSTQSTETGLPSGQVSARNIPMMTLLTFAYDVREDYIMGGPNWLRSDRFDIIAKAPPDTPRTNLPLMLQALLAQEFKLKIHREQKPMDVFVLTVGKGGPKIQSAAGSGAADCQRSVTQEGFAEATCKNITMAELGKRLQSLAPGYVDREVVDQTGLQGKYDLKLDWVSRITIDQQGGLTMFGALEKMTGLKLEERKIPMPVIMIDHVEKLPEE